MATWRCRERRYVTINNVDDVRSLMVTENVISCLRRVDVTYSVGIWRDRSMMMSAKAAAYSLFGIWRMFFTVINDTNNANTTMGGVVRRANLSSFR